MDHHRLGLFDVLNTTILGRIEARNHGDMHRHDGNGGTDA